MPPESKTSPAIDKIRFARDAFVKLVDDLNPGQMNFIPPGFKNNLIWNLAHAVAVQQALCYMRTDSNPVIPKEFIDTYQKGTAPTEAVSASEITRIKQLAINTVDQLQDDLGKKIFGTYNPLTVTAHKLPVNTIDDALDFVAFHEALHLGYAQSLKRAVIGEQALEEAA
jgi:hypothetical protein